MESKAENKKWNKIFKNVFTPKVISSTWKKEGMEVSNLNMKFTWKILYLKIVFKKDKYILNPEEKTILKYLIARGTPNYFRPNLWLLCSRAKLDLENNTSYYHKLLELSKEVPSLYEKQIDKDINRTNSETIKKFPDFKRKMKNILMCYSIRNSSIGYCQGFNFLVLRLLEVLIGEVIIYFYNIIGRIILGFLWINRRNITIKLL